MSSTVDRPGQCKRCTRPAVPGLKHCAVDLARQRARYRARMEAGRCGRCPRPQVPGYHFCEDHLKPPGHGRRAPRRPWKPPPPPRPTRPATPPRAEKKAMPERPPKRAPERMPERVPERITAERTVAYVSWRLFLRASDELRDGIPACIDASTWPTLSTVARSQTMSAYRFFGFIDRAGVPQPRLRAWVAASIEERQAMMAALLPEFYPEVMPLIAQDGTPYQVHAAIERLGVSGSTIGRAVGFFLKAARFAGVTVPDSWRAASRATLRDVSIHTYALRGGTITLTVSTDLRRLAPADRTFVLAIIDQLEKYGQA